MVSSFRRMLGTKHAARRYDRAGPPAVLGAELAALARQSEQATGRRKTLLTRGILLMLYALIGGPLIFVLLLLAAGAAASMTEEPIFQVAFVGAAVVVGGLNLLVALSFRRRGALALDELEPEKVALATAALQTVSADFDPTMPVHLFVDFCATQNTPYVQHGMGLAYFHRWLHLRAPLADRSSLSIDALVRMKRKTVPKPRYTKQKSVIQDVVDVRVSFKRGTMLAPDAAAQIQTKLVYVFPRMMRIRTSDRAVFLRHVTAPCREVRGRGVMVQGQEQRLVPRTLQNLIFRDYRAAAGARHPGAAAPR
jgi:hypothetical protein